MKEIRECHDWLARDLAKVHPNVPILVSGSKAVMSVLGKDRRVNSSRRKIHTLDSHPVVVCENFANVARYLTKKVTSTYKRRKDGLEMPSAKSTRLLTPVPLSPPWCLIEDVQLIKEEVIDFINKYK
jgi:uracil-DNA glycosylase